MTGAAMRAVARAVMLVALAGVMAGMLAGRAMAQAPMPADQQRFLALVDRFAEAYRTAPNDMARGAVRPERARALCAAVRGLSVRGWVGTVETLSSTNDGRGVLALRLGSQVTVKTWNNSLSDSGDRTLIASGTPLFAAAAALRKGQRVVFDGRFVAHRDDCIRESSLTVSGAMNDPEFVIRFSAVRGE